MALPGFGGCDRIAWRHMSYTVQSGDCMSSIAYSHGFFWQTLWNLPQNAALKAKRTNPNVLMTGDIVYIPDLQPKTQTCAANSQYQFALKGVPEKLQITLLDANHQPRPNVEYVIVIDGDARRGTSDGDGKIVEKIPPNAMKGKLTYPSPPDPTGQTTKEVMFFQLGGLNPISEVSGLKARLCNLGLYRGPIDENVNDALTRAISAFQKNKGLPVTGQADDATKAQIQAIHSH